MSDSGLRRRDRLELRKLQLEVREQDARARRGWRPPAWERWGDRIKWLGIVVPVFVSILVFFSDRAKDQRLEQQQQRLEFQQLEQQRLEAMAFALEKLKGAPEAIALYLTQYGKDAAPILLGLTRVDNRLADENWPWPATSFAVIEALDRIGVKDLSDQDLSYLGRLADEGLLGLRRFIALPKTVVRPDEVTPEVKQRAEDLRRAGQDAALVTGRILCLLDEHPERDESDRICNLKKDYEVVFYPERFFQDDCPALAECPEVASG